MLLTTKGRYAVTSIIDLAQKNQIKPSSIADIATRQNISINYLEQIFNKLKKAQIVRSVRGPGGGYILNNAPDNICVADIIKAVEEPIKFTKCSSDTRCNNHNTKCQTHNLWKGLETHVIEYLSNITIADIGANKPIKI